MKSSRKLYRSLSTLTKLAGGGVVSPVFPDKSPATFRITKFILWTLFCLNSFSFSSSPASAKSARLFTLSTKPFKRTLVARSEMSTLTDSLGSMWLWGTNTDLCVRQTASVTDIVPFSSVKNLLKTTSTKSSKLQLSEFLTCPTFTLWWRVHFVFVGKFFKNGVWNFYWAVGSINYWHVFTPTLTIVYILQDQGGLAEQFLRLLTSSLFWIARLNICGIVPLNW